MEARRKQREAERNKTHKKEESPPTATTVGLPVERSRNTHRPTHSMEARRRPAKSCRKKRRLGHTHPIAEKKERKKEKITDCTRTNHKVPFKNHMNDENAKPVGQN